MGLGFDVPPVAVASRGPNPLVSALLLALLASAALLALLASAALLVPFVPALLRDLLASGPLPSLLVAFVPHLASSSLAFVFPTPFVAADRTLFHSHAELLPSKVRTRQQPQARDFA